MEDASEKSLSRETLKGVAAKFSMNLIGFGGTVIFARVLGAEGLGDFYTLMSVAALVNQVPSAFSSAIKKRASEVGGQIGELLGVVFR